MANGMTRLALAKMQIDGKQSGQHEYVDELLLEGDKKALKKITLKNPLPHNHSK